MAMTNFNGKYWLHWTAYIFDIWCGAATQQLERIGCLFKRNGATSFVFRWCRWQWIRYAAIVVVVIRFGCEEK